MRKILATFCLMVVSAAATLTVLAACGSYFQPYSADTFNGIPCQSYFEKTAHWRLFFTNGHETNDLQVTAAGHCFLIVGQPDVPCYPGFMTPYWVNADTAKWNQKTSTPSRNTVTNNCLYNEAPFQDHFYSYYCNSAIAGCSAPPPTGTNGFWNFSTTSCSAESSDCPDYCEESGSGWEPLDICLFQNGCNLGFGQPERDSPCCWNGTPILIDVNGDGFNLSDAGGGVRFDLIGDGRPIRVAWPGVDSDDAWLALDRNNNGTIDGGPELFGNFTSQPAPPAGEKRNGFLALNEYDRFGNGGDESGAIEAADDVFSSLRLWQDANHNGISEANELHTLQSLGIEEFALNYKHSKKVDQHGNEFRYRAKVRTNDGSQVGRWAWDVIPRFQH